MMVGRRSFPFGKGHFQGLLLFNFQEVSVHPFPTALARLDPIFSRNFPTAKTPKAKIASVEMADRSVRYGCGAACANHSGMACLKLCKPMEGDLTHRGSLERTQNLHVQKFWGEVWVGKIIDSWGKNPQTIWKICNWQPPTRYINNPSGGLS